MGSNKKGPIAKFLVKKGKKVQQLTIRETVVFNRHLGANLSEGETIIKATGCRSIPADTALLKVLSLLLQRNCIFSLLLFHCKKSWQRGRSDIDGADISALKMHLAQKFAS